MRFIALLLLALLAAGCATVPEGHGRLSPEQQWQRHRQQLSALAEAWHLSGRIAIQTADEGGSASIDWRQVGENYSIRIIGPIGTGSLLLEGDHRQVSLQTQEGRAHSDDPEGILYEQLGWRIPIRALRYWVMGLPAPGAVDQQLLGEEGVLLELEQAGWRIRFSDYIRYDGTLLPERIFVDNHRAKVRLAIREWELGSRP